MGSDWLVFCDCGFHSVCPLIPSLSAYCLTWVSLTSDVGYVLMTTTPDLGCGVSPLCHPCARTTVTHCSCADEWSRAKANRVSPKEHNGHRKHPLPTTRENILHMDITKWPTRKSDWLYSLQPKMDKFYIVSKNRTRGWLWLISWTPYWQIQT